MIDSTASSHLIRTIAVAFTALFAVVVFSFALTGTSWADEAQNAPSSGTAVSGSGQTGVEVGNDDVSKGDPGQAPSQDGSKDGDKKPDVSKPDGSGAGKAPSVNNGSGNKNDGAADVENDAQTQNKPEASKPQTTPADKNANTNAATNTSSNAEKEPVKYEDSHMNMYRLYNPNSGEHLYTSSLHEAVTIAGVGWRWEGIGWVSPKSGGEVYRLYNPYTGDHHYTTSVNERNQLRKLGWRYEGIGWYSDGKDQTAVYRQFNPYENIGSHNFTTSKNENDKLKSIGWRAEGIAWYATKGPNLEVKAQWLVTNAWGSKERYWIAKDGNIAKSRFITPEEGAGYTAYAKGNGAVVRGKYDLNNGYVFVAEQNGRLASTSDGKDGWLVTSKYDGGLQRYYYVASKKAMHSGFFTVDGNQYFGVAKQGYVFRGKTTWGDKVLLSNNDGVMAKGSGWMVTSKYDGSLQRYYLVSAWNGYAGARTGLFTVDGKKYYGMPNAGYVARNRYIQADRWYTANNDGVLTASVSPDQAAMLSRAMGFSSRTDYLVMVDINNCKVGVLKGSKDNWNIERYESCVCGAPGTPTITGTYSTGYHLDSLPKWPNALHCTNITGGYFFHSVLGSTSELGQHLSHGCVRLDWPYARYIQSLPYGSTVHLYHG